MSSMTSGDNREALAEALRDTFGDGEVDSTAPGDLMHWLSERGLVLVSKDTLTGDQLTVEWLAGATRAAYAAGQRAALTRYEAVVEAAGRFLWSPGDVHEHGRRKVALRNALAALSEAASEPTEPPSITARKAEYAEAYGDETEKQRKGAWAPSEPTGERR